LTVLAPVENVVRMRTRWATLLAAPLLWLGGCARPPLSQVPLPSAAGGANEPLLPVREGPRPAAGQLLVRVLDAQGRAIDGALVRLSASVGAVQRDSGVVLPRVPAGTHQLMVQAIGYERREVLVELDGPGGRDVSVPLRRSLLESSCTMAVRDERRERGRWWRFW
jgi:hypothetical protein